MILPILTYPHPTLRQKAEIVKDVGKEIRKLAENMAETMYNAPGVGLAAPQIGQSLQLIVIDPTGQKAQGLMVLINPKIVAAEGEVEEEEGCLSIPDFYFKIKRYSKVRVKGYDPLKEKTIEIEADGLLARIFQHEIDHLEGTLIIDHLGRVKRELYHRRILKHLKKK
ncbi:MAG: peptide deformylase [Deltaproteobacteria bacterium]|nr:peptide deformylase [Deltaproteobacteria bacterium]